MPKRKKFDAKFKHVFLSLHKNAGLGFYSQKKHVLFLNFISSNFSRVPQTSNNIKTKMMIETANNIRGKNLSLLKF